MLGTARGVFGRPRTGRLPLIGLTGSVVLAMSIAACSGAPLDEAKAGDTPKNSDAAAVYEELNGLDGDKAVERATELAKKESGKVLVYTPINTELITNFVKPFEEKYGIDVEIFQGNANDVLQRTAQEHSAGKSKADVVDNIFTAMIELEKLGLFVPFEGPSADSHPDRSKYGSWVEISRNIFHPSWNKQLVPNDLVPAKWEDLADPKFKGLLTLELSDAEWFASVTELWRKDGKSEDEITKLWAGIVANSNVARGHTTTQEMLNAGQTGLMLSQYTYIAQNAVKAGAPTTFKGPDGKSSIVGFSSANGVGLMKSSTNPASAWLLVDYLISEEGQKQISAQGLTPSRDLPSDETRVGLEVVPIDGKMWAAEQAEWTTKYDELLRGVEKAK